MLKKILMIGAFSIITILGYGLEITGNNNHIIEYEIVQPDGGKDISGTKYIFFDGSFNFVDTGFSLGFHSAKKQGTNNFDLLILEVYPRYAFPEFYNINTGIEFGYKSEIPSGGKSSDKIKIKPWMSTSFLDEKIGLYSEFIYEDSIRGASDWKLYEFLVGPSTPLNEKTRIGVEFKFARETANGDKIFDKLFAKPYVNYTIIDQKLYSWFLVEIAQLDFKNGNEKTEIKPLAGLSYKILDNLNVFGELSYKFESEKIVGGNTKDTTVPFVKVGLGYNF